MPLLPAGLLTGVFAFAILAAELRGVRHLEAVITVLVGVIVAGFASPDGACPSRRQLGRQGMLTPRFQDSESVLLAAGILGATVMPHVIYLHSALTQRRVVGADAERAPAHLPLRADRRRDRDVDRRARQHVDADHRRGRLPLSRLDGIGDIDEAYRGLGSIVGDHADVVFGIALLASGLSSSSVGTLAGQVVMQGYINRQIPLFLRRIITMAPALVVLAIGVNPSSALVISQVALSFGIPFALIPLVIFCRNRELMGDLANRRLTNVAAYLVVGVIVSLNVFLIYDTVLG